MSYRTECAECGQTHTAAARYCPFCGVPVDREGLR